MAGGPGEESAAEGEKIRCGDRHCKQYPVRLLLSGYAARWIEYHER